jgi:hypothetical protein
MSEYTNIKRKIRSILNLMSDETFLGSIDTIDFKNHYIHIKSGYWRTIVIYIKNTFDKNSFILSNVLTNIKNMWFKRIADVSATKFKKFFMQEIKSYYFNFKNIVYYANSLTKDVKDYEKLRKIRYYEKKAKKYYLYSLKIKKVPIYKEQEESDVETFFPPNELQTNDFSNVTDLEDFENDSDSDESEVSDEKSEVLAKAQEYALQVLTGFTTFQDLREMQNENIFPKPSELDFGEDIDGKHPENKATIVSVPIFLDLIYREWQRYNKVPTRKLVKYYSDKKIDPEKVNILANQKPNLRVSTAERLYDERPLIMSGPSHSNPDLYSGQTYFEVTTTSIQGSIVDSQIVGDMDWTNSFIDECKAD